MFSNAKRAAVVIVLATLAAQAAPPEGWYVAGSQRMDYDTGIDNQTVYNGRPSAFLKSKKAGISGFGTLMQDFKADQYLGKRVRFSAFVKADTVADWAGLWMRVDKGSDPIPLSFDNMKDRPIKGTTGWQNYEVVLDVPQNATGIAFGILLGGTGSVWLNSAKIEIVPDSIPVTGGVPKIPQIPDGPQNLDFQK